MRILRRRWTLSQCAKRYLEDCTAMGQSPRTLESKNSSLNLFIRWCDSINLLLACKVTPEHLEKYRRHLCRFRQPFSHKPLELSTQRNRLTAVKVMFRHLRRRLLISRDPAMNFELPRVRPGLPTGMLSEAEVDAVMKHIQLACPLGLRDRAILEVLYATGIRRMELANVNIVDLDRSRYLLSVIKGKGGKDRQVPIAPRACQWVEHYIAEARPILAQPSSGNTLFLDRDGRKLRGHQLSHLVGKYLSRAGIRQRGACGVFRHTAATLMHENGADLRYVQELLGHASISTTQIYSHVTISRLREVYTRTHPAAFKHPRVPAGIFLETT